MIIFMSIRGADGHGGGYLERVAPVVRPDSLKNSSYSSSRSNILGFSWMVVSAAGIGTAKGEGSGFPGGS